MEKELSGDERRKKIISLIENTQTPLSGSALGKKLGVSRQVIVQDIALLRSCGYSVISTPRGYHLETAGKKTKARIIKVYHTEKQVEEELNTIVDLGGTVQSVIINHRVYGRMEALLNIKNRRDVRGFLENIQSGKSTPLMNITSGYHFHKIEAETTEILDEIEEALKEKGFLAPILDYENME